MLHPNISSNRSRESGASEGKLVSDSGMFSRSGGRARFDGRFSEMQSALDGWMLARAPASAAQVPPNTKDLDSTTSLISV